MMERISWNASFSVGIANLDEQHKRFIDMIKMLVDNSGACVVSEIISDVLAKMTKYSRSHFKEEELLVVEYGYPCLTAHHRNHSEYRKKTAKLCFDVMEMKSLCSK